MLNITSRCKILMILKKEARGDSARHSPQCQEVVLPAERVGDFADRKGTSLYRVPNRLKGPAEQEEGGQGGAQPEETSAEQ